MAKIVVQNDTNPDIGIVLDELTGLDGHSKIWDGNCTQCGWSFMWENEDEARAVAQAHVDTHDGEE